MAWDLLRGRERQAERGSKFQSQIFGVECRNFWDCFRTVWAEFREYFRTVRVEFSRLFSNSL